MIEFRQIEYGTPEHESMIDLRIRVLKELFGIPYTDKEKEGDKVNVLLGAFFPDSKQVVGCCLLTSMGVERTIKLRQMAVDFFYQKKGLGTELIDYAELMALKMNHNTIYLHARKTALNFYKKLGYTIEEDEFMEVGIPHYGMMKILE